MTPAAAALFAGGYSRAGLRAGTIARFAKLEARNFYFGAHSVRGFLSGTIGKKMGLVVTSTKSEDGERKYSVSR